MTLDRIGPRVEWLKASGYIVFVYTLRIEPIVQRSAPAAVAEHTSVPDPFQRRHLVVASAAACIHRQIRIGSYRNEKNVVFRGGTGRRREAGSGRQFIIGVERRRVASMATFMLEDFLSVRRE